jgi:hypothetical protein
VRRRTRPEEPGPNRPADRPSPIPTAPRMPSTSIGASRGQDSRLRRLGQPSRDRIVRRQHSIAYEVKRQHPPPRPARSIPATRVPRSSPDANGGRSLAPAPETRLGGSDQLRRKDISSWR